MKATRHLPSNYRRQSTLDLSQNRLLQISLNGLGTLLFFGCSAAFLWLAAALRFNRSQGALTFQITPETFPVIALKAMLLILLTLVGHELVHALFFGLFTRHPAVFGVKGLYAYAAAPDWFLPRNQHLVVTLAPLFLITGVGLILLVLVPLSALPGVLTVLVINTAGSIGDLVTAGWLLTQPWQTYVNDYGDGMTLYANRSALVALSHQPPRRP